MSHQEHDKAVDASHWNGELRDEWVHADKDAIHISARAMKITWGDDDRFWKWIPLPKEMLPRDFSSGAVSFNEAALLVQVSWLEVSGSLDLDKYKDHLSQSQTYEIIYHIKFKNDAFGWSNALVTFLAVVTADGQSWKKSEKLDSYRNGGTDKWHEIHGGEFKLPQRLPQSSVGKLEIGMLDVQTQWWKGGLVFAGVTIRPKIEH